MTKILVLTTEPVPLPGMVATGAGMRAWGLALGLRSAGFSDVTLAFAADAIRGQDIEIKVPGVMTFERSKLDDFIAAQSPGVIVFQHWGLMAEMKRTPECPVAIDLAGPHLLERRLWGSRDPKKDLQQKLDALSRADFTVCSGAFQRHYFLPFLIQAGHEPAGHMCPVIPFSLSPDLPEAADDKDFAQFVYTGMFLPWQDPSIALRAVVETLEEKDRGRLVFVGGPHPSADVSGGKFDALLAMLKKSEKVEIHPVMPFEQLLGVMRKSGVAIDLMAANAERELAFPTRTVTYMWAGLPPIHNDFDELAEPIARSKAGWTFDPNDSDGVKKQISRLLGHREDVERRADKARKLVTENYTWDKTIEPLAKWCRDPKIREDKRAPMIAVSSEKTPAKKPRAEGKITYAPSRPATQNADGPWYASPIVFVLALPISVALLLLFGMAELVRLAFNRR